MPSSEYSNAVGGGLKLKGAKDAGVKKHKKKKEKKDKVKSVTESEPSTTPKEETTLQEALAEEEQYADKKAPEEEIKQYGKTEAQRRHDEMRRKRLDERLQREGIKTHKQRVEELNKYLSGLSEHHDMPRIGPG